MYHILPPLNGLILHHKPAFNFECYSKCKLCQRLFLSWISLSAEQMEAEKEEHNAEIERLQRMCHYRVPSHDALFFFLFLVCTLFICSFMFHSYQIGFCLLIYLFVNLLLFLCEHFFDSYLFGKTLCFIFWCSAIE